MAVTVEWYDPEETILRYTYDTHWAWPDLQEALIIGRGMMQEKPYIVSVVHDLSATLSFPSSMISNMRHFINQRPDNIGMVVFVSNRMFINGLFRVFRQMFPNLIGQYIHATTLDTAIDNIKSWQETNSDIPSS